MDAAQQADQTYRAQRHAELSHRMRWPLRPLAFFDGDRPLGFLINGTGVGMLLIVVGIIGGLVIISSFFVPRNLLSSTALQLRAHVEETLKREGLTPGDLPPADE